MSHKMNRRNFLHKALHTSIGMSFLGGMSPMMASDLMQKSLDVSLQKGVNDYKALVCIDLKGGNDGFNMILPTGAGTGVDSYADYQKARGGVFNQRTNARGVALAENAILALGANAKNLGIHNRMPEIQQLFNDEKIAVVANLGPLIRPTNKADYLAGKNLPAHLFSHSDQQILWVAPQADATERRGWGGVIADEFRATNPNQDLPMNISAGGENVFQVGQKEIPFYVDLKGTIKLRFAPDTNGTCEYDYGQCGAYQEQIAELQKHPLRQAYASAFSRAIQRNSMIEDAISAFPVTDKAFEPFWVTFGKAPSEANFTSLPHFVKELFIIARIIRVQKVLNMRRQTFYAQLSGFDTHDDLLVGQAKLLGVLSKSLGAFQQVLDNLNLAENVTTFTASEFGRTTSSNGDGTDHGWGSHHFVMGGAVKGGQLYGKLPNLSPDKSNPDNAIWGQIIPTLSAEQYAATLCHWFGLSDVSRDTIFPNLRYMTGSKLAISGANLGFMNA